MSLFIYILSIPKSFYVCLHYFSFFQALRLPIIVRYNTRLKALRGRIICHVPLRTGLLKIGFGDVGIVDSHNERAILELNDGIIELYGKVSLGTASRLSLGAGGHLVWKGRCINTARTTIICFDNITFGEKVLISWDTTIIDTDFHEVMDSETHNSFPRTAPISIGANTWICLGSTLLKGSTIPEGCIVGAKALVTKKFTTTNSILAGNPATIKKQRVTLNPDTF